MTALAVSEVFGPTFQGEGPSAGRRACFVRLGRCNLNCSWCDTPYTWDWDRYDPAVELSTVEVDDLAVQAAAYGTPLVVVTGGEPLVQATGLNELLKLLSDRLVEVETNGTRPLLPHLGHVTYNVSPKLAHSGVEAVRAIKLDVLLPMALRPDVSFKFVCRTADDVDEVSGLVRQLGVPPSKVWVMPEGTEANVLAVRSLALADAVLSAGYNLSGRLHVALWGDVRGR